MAVHVEVIGGGEQDEDEPHRQVHLHNNMVTLVTTGTLRLVHSQDRTKFRGYSKSGLNQIV